MVDTHIFYGEKRSWRQAMMRGFAKTCPACGKGKIFAGYTKNHDNCSQCGLHIAGHKADDAPPYLTIMVIGHIVIPLSLTLRNMVDLSLTAQFLIWLPVLVIATWAFLPCSKGAMIGLQWANHMHGFGNYQETPVNDADNTIENHQ